jgi:hypothetical protein
MAKIFKKYDIQIAKVFLKNDITKFDIRMPVLIIF